jgi:acetyltransferase
MSMNAYTRSVHSHEAALAPQIELFRSMRGRQIATRPVTPSDAGLIADLLSGLSARSLFLRYCMPIPRMAPEMLAREVARLEQTHSMRQLTLVALARVAGADRIIGVAEMVRDTSSPAIAEIALVVADAYQREGIGSALCANLIAAARPQGMAALRALALAENAAVRRLVARSGAPYTAEIRQGMISIQIDLAG